mgnify:FL=1
MASKRRNSAASRRPAARSRRGSSAAIPGGPPRRVVSLVTLILAVGATLVGSCFRRQASVPVASPPAPAASASAPAPRANRATPAPPPPGPRLATPSGLPKAPEGDVAAVGTFNIEWFSLGGKNARSESDLRNIADVIRQTGCVVLGVEEVQDEAALAALVRHLPGWKFQLGTSGRQQRCGILWDASRATVGRAAEWPDVNEGLEKGGRGSLRAPLVAPVKIGQFDFTLVVLHLKAMFDPEDIRTRRTQLRRIRDRVEKEAVARKDEDFVIVGDFNDFADSDALKELTDGRRGKLRFVVTGARLPKTVSSYLGRSGRIDHIVVTSPAVTQQEWTGEAFVYPKPKGKERELYEKSVSDHLPSWATFKTDRDYDP